MTALGGDLEHTMRAAMEQQQMSVAGLARAAGVRRELIYQWWRGEQRPSRSSLARVAAPLGLEADALLAIYGSTPSEDADLTRTLIAEQRATREMLERVLSSLAPAAPGLRPEDWEEIRSQARQEAERLLQESGGRSPRTPRSTPSPAGHPMRRQSDSA